MWIKVLTNDNSYDIFTSQQNDSFKKTGLNGSGTTSMGIFFLVFSGFG